MDNGNWQTAATLFFGALTPVIAQLFRWLSEKRGIVVKGIVAQVVALVVAGVMGIAIAAGTGNLEWNGDLVESGATVFAVGAFVYQLFKAHFDGYLPSKV